jgi:hypothetical protein
MTRRPGFPPSRAGLVARLAVSVVVATGAAVGAVLVHSTPAEATSTTTAAASPTAAPANEGVAVSTAQQLLSDFATPSGASRLPGAPSGAPAAATSTFVSTLPYAVTRTAWWRVTQPASALITWVDAHPEPGLVPTWSQMQLGGPASVPSTTLFGFPSSHALDGISVYVYAFTLADGSTVLRVDAEVAYAPPRPASETVPAATTLIAVPAFAEGATSSAPEVTLTDALKIAQITKVVNSLPKAPVGVMCPMDTGAGIALVFENAQGETLADVVVGVSGCEDVQVTIGGYKEPVLGDGGQAAAKIQTILGTQWELTR